MMVLGMRNCSSQSEASLLYLIPPPHADSGSVPQSCWRRPAGSMP